MYDQQVSCMSPALQQMIADLQVGNAVTDGRQIVIGMGSSMLINAALYAFSNVSRSPGGNPRCLRDLF